MICAKKAKLGDEDMTYLKLERPEDGIECLGEQVLCPGS